MKAAPLLNPNLDALPTAQLQQLVHAQEETLKRARSMLVRLHAVKLASTAHAWEALCMSAPVYAGGLLMPGRLSALPAV